MGVPSRRFFLITLLAVAAWLAPQALAKEITCEVQPGAGVVCAGVHYETHRTDAPGTTAFYVDIIVSAILVVVAGIMSGLTIGLLSLDTTTLQVLKASGEPNERIYAAGILPLLARRHLLLVSLLISNSLCMEALPIFLDKIMPSWAAVLVSVTAVLLFGEIIPQAICSRHGLAIGYYMAVPVWMLIGVLYVIAWPISLVLDYILGEVHESLFARGELKELVYLHGQERDDQEERLTTDEVTIIRGALDMKQKTVADAMTSLPVVYAVSITRVLDVTLLEEISRTGHSRIPVYEGEKDNIVGGILVKRLILVEPSAKLPVRDAMNFYLPSVLSSNSLYDMLNEFQKGQAHMAIVKDKVTRKTVGVITLEDIIEELIAEEIVDETDLYVDVEKGVHVIRPTRTGARKNQGLRSSKPVVLRVSRNPTHGNTTDHTPLLRQNTANPNYLGTSR